MTKRALLPIALALTGALATAGSAGAATVSIGSPLDKTFAELNVGANGQVTFAQTALPGSLVASPHDGTVVSWQARLEGGPFNLRVVRPLGGTSYIGTGKSADYTPASFEASPVVPTSLPIKAGDLIGLETTSGNGLDVFGAASPTPGATGIGWALPALSSTEPDESFPLVPDIEIALRATVRYCLVPDLARMKIAKAREILAAADCTAGAITKPKKKSKRKKAKFVVRQSSPAGTAISDTAPIDLKLGKKPKKKQKDKKGK
jgi:hypothetical protein